MFWYHREWTDERNGWKQLQFLSRFYLQQISWANFTIFSRRFPEIANKKGVGLTIKCCPKDGCGHNRISLHLVFKCALWMRNLGTQYDESLLRTSDCARSNIACPSTVLDAASLSCRFASSVRFILYLSWMSLKDSLHFEHGYIHHLSISRTRYLIVHSGEIPGHNCFHLKSLFLNFK